MASAFRDKSGWIIDFRGLENKRRRVRLKNVASKSEAVKIAKNCDHYCRQIEDIEHPDDRIIEHALRIKAITRRQAQTFFSLRDVSYRPVTGPLTLIEAAGMHPSTKRDRANAYREHLRHETDLHKFIQFSGIETCADLRLEHVQSWIEHMTDLGLAFDTRRHAILYIRRAAQVAQNHQIANPLAGYRLDRRTKRNIVEVYSLNQLCAGYANLLTSGNLRPAATLALGGFMGLRPSEIARLKVCDVSGDNLVVGAREAKNLPSQRVIPIPGVMTRLVARLADDQPAGHALIPVVRGNQFKKVETGEHYDYKNLGKYAAPIIAQACGTEGFKIKLLRKSFRTIAYRHKLSNDHIEAIIGHKISSLPAVSESSYIAGMVADELRPVMDQMNGIIEAQLSTHLSTNFVTLMDSI